MKAKEYRNDFNKKILEKRLNAWVTAEQLLLPLRASVYLSSIDDKERFGFFQSENSFKKLRTSLDDNLVSQLFWLGEDYGTQLIIFINTMRSITKRCRRIGEIGEDGTNVLDLTMLLQEGADAHNVLMESYDKMFTSLSFILSDLHDIDTFLEKKRQDFF